MIYNMASNAIQASALLTLVPLFLVRSWGSRVLSFALSVVDSLSSSGCPGWTVR